MIAKDFANASAKQVTLQRDGTATKESLTEKLMTERFSARTIFLSSIFLSAFAPD
jgi:hypothetical protein